MNESLVNIICTVISSFCVLLGVILSNRSSTDRMQKITIAVMNSIPFNLCLIVKKYCNIA